jgi:glycosyltransferase involved in cell wall biosynthesis
MGLYAEVLRQAECPVKITLYHCDRSSANMRSVVGLRNDEFSDVEMIPIGCNIQRGRRVIEKNPGWLHIFCIWQKAPEYRYLIDEIRKTGGKYAIACEAPCNMHYGMRRFIQEIYYRTLLPLRGKSLIENAEFFLNYSGNDDRLAKLIGWRDVKIIPFGYFPPPIEQSHFVKRKAGGPFVILSTGVMSQHRGADILVRGLNELSNRGVAYRAIMTQKGPLYDSVKRYAQKHNLPIEFPGFVDMDNLVQMYETCSVFVGSGRDEPWGMRLNDALNCGAPLVVSRGMGGVKMIDDYQCGLEFGNENYVDLANKLQQLTEDDRLYASCVVNVKKAREKIMPQYQAKVFLQHCRERVKS